MPPEPPEPFSWRREASILARLGAPTGLLFALRTAQLLTDQAVVGHLTDDEGRPTALYLDAASQALLWMNLTLQCMVRGVGGAINVLVSNALGAGNRELSGAWLQVGVLAATASALFVALLWLLAAPALSQLIVQDGGGEAASGDDPGGTAGVPPVAELAAQRG